MSEAISHELQALSAQWSAAWPRALAVWSRYTQLSPPRFCLTQAAEKTEDLTGSFAMIRLRDHAVVISLRLVAEKKLGHLALPVLAHEIGHHVLAPADLSDNARLIRRIQRGLREQAHQAPLVGNLYTDLLINDRLQREAGLDMVGVYRALGQAGPPSGDLFRLYLRIYERLWELSPGELAGPVSASLDFDASLGAQVVRAWRRDWLRGAGRFALLIKPYLEKTPTGHGWLDALSAGAGAGVPDGLLGDDDDGDLVHPAEEGLAPASSGSGASSGGHSGPDTRDKNLGSKTGPAEYLSLMRTLGVTGTPEQQIARYYRELARPYLIPFPSRPLPRAADPLPEGTERWDVGDPLAEIDWVASMVQNPRVIPGITTARRVFGEAPGGDPAREVPDLYLGVDCSGSMPNPSQTLSYPVLAGAVMVGSAIRAGASVMVTLSGESPGKWTSTNSFGRQEMPALEVLTRHLGTGYSFGIERLRDTVVNGPRLKKPTHVLVVSDSDLFAMIQRTADGEALMRQVAATCGAGATAVLNLSGGRSAEVRWLEGLGWTVAEVAGLPALLDFARSFSRRTFGAAPERRSPHGVQSR